MNIRELRHQGEKRIGAANKFFKVITLKNLVGNQVTASPCDTGDCGCFPTAATFPRFYNRGRWGGCTMGLKSSLYAGRIAKFDPVGIKVRDNLDDIKIPNIVKWPGFQICRITIIPAQLFDKFRVFRGESKGKLSSAFRRSHFGKFNMAVKNVFTKIAFVHSQFICKIRDQDKHLLPPIHKVIYRIIPHLTTNCQIPTGAANG